MTSFEYSWQTTDKIEIHGKCWMPDDGQPKAIIALVHGFGEHIERYNHVAAFFTSKQYSFIGFDQRGHGKTKGKRGVVPSYTEVLHNVTEYLSLIKEKFPEVPIFLYGHSMGGNIVTSYLLKEKPNFLKGAIVTSPWLRLANDPPAWQEKIGQFIGGLIKDFTIPSKLNPDDLSTDLTVGKVYVKDPLVHNKICTALYFGVKDAGEWNIENANQLSVPTLIMHGDDDKITSYSASELFSQNAPSNLIKFKGWKGLRHEMHNEKIKDQVFNEMLHFLEERTLEEKES